ncbi:MAG: hypothetical protein KDK59_00755 [Simkania sp.]|nr:hypothetical protein [Simkania sp.]MCP5491323.1 hypothetical protein [Chlamydiales bacterium]
MDIQSINNQNISSNFAEVQTQISSSDSATAALNQQLSQIEDAAKSHVSSMGNPSTIQFLLGQAHQIADSIHNARNPN